MDCKKCIKLFKYFFGKSVKNKIMRKHNISLDLYYENKNKINATNGQCEKEYLFTPDGQYCYRCDDEIIGMPGCKGGCDFSLNRNRILKCKGECKEGYIESSEGVCSSCNVISKGCHECHYENEYPDNYKGPKRARRFVCDYCEDGFMQSLSGECQDCEDLGLGNCSKCELNPNKTDNYVCTQCEEGFFIDEDGECEICYEDEFKSFTSNKCADCDDTSEGGIEYCSECESDGKKVTCKECYYNYILLTNNHSCIERSNTEIQHYDNCLELTLNSDKYECTRCAYDYSLIDKKGCVYTPSLYDRNFYYYHRNYYIALYMNTYGQKGYVYNYFESNYSNFKENDYIYMRNADLYSCQKAVNLGTEDNPLYSCIKCNSHYKDLYDDVATITEINSNISFCMRQKKRDDLEYCSKATYKMEDAKDVYNCTECIKNYALAFNKISKTYYCAATNATNKCLVLYCKNCNPNDGYICEECLPDYKINTASGSCVKKTKVVPAVTWKDIYKLEMNGVKEVNNKVIQGPTLSMTGITSSQINTRHAFIIYLTFKLKTSLRYLEEKEITMEAICEIKEGVEQTSNDVNLVEYECIGITNTTEDLSNYQLSDIKEAFNVNFTNDFCLDENSKINLLKKNYDKRLANLLINFQKTINNITKDNAQELINDVVFMEKEKVISDLFEQNAIIKNEYEENKNEMSRLQEVISALEIDLHKTQKKLELINEENQRLNDSLSKQQAENFNLNLKIKQLLEQIDNDKNDINYNVNISKELNFSIGNLGIGEIALTTGQEKSVLQLTEELMELNKLKDNKDDFNDLNDNFTSSTMNSNTLANKYEDIINNSKNKNKEEMKNIFNKNEKIINDLKVEIKDLKELNKKYQNEIDNNSFEFTRLNNKLKMKH